MASPLCQVKAATGDRNRCLSILDLVPVLAVTAAVAEGTPVVECRPAAVKRATAWRLSRVASACWGPGGGGWEELRYRRASPSRRGRVPVTAITARYEHAVAALLMPRPRHHRRGGWKNAKALVFSRILHG